MTATSIFEQVTERINDAHTSGEISNRVVEVLAERENARRTRLLTEAMDRLIALQAAYDAVNKPDGKTFPSSDLNAQPILTFSEARRNEVAKAQKAQIEMSRAITEALTAANYDALEKALRKNERKEPVPA